MKSKVRFRLYDVFPAFIVVFIVAFLVAFISSCVSVFAFPLNEHKGSVFAPKFHLERFLPREFPESQEGIARPANNEIAAVKNIKKNHSSVSSSGINYKETGDIIVCGDYYWPLHGNTRISSPYGWRNHPITGEKHFHGGVDIPAPEGTPIHAAADGVVYAATHQENSGNMIILNHSDSVQTTYLHCSKLLVSEGETVKADQVIALVGNTGTSTGPHLDFRFYVHSETVDPVEQYQLKADPLSEGTYYKKFVSPNSGDQLSYFAFVPERAVKGMPLVISLHEEKDTGSLSELKQNPMISQAKSIYGNAFPFIAISTCLSSGSWTEGNTLDTVRELVDYVVRYYGIDSDCIIITGSNDGAVGACNMVSSFPGVFSKLVPVNGIFTRSSVVFSISQIDLWGFVSKNITAEHLVLDSMSSLIRSVQQNGGTSKLTVLNDNASQNSMANVFTADLFEWMVS